MLRPLIRSTDYDAYILRVAWLIRLRRHRDEYFQRMKGGYP